MTDYSFSYILGWRSWWSRCQSSRGVAKFSCWGIIKDMPRKGDGWIKIDSHHTIVMW